MDLTVSDWFREVTPWQQRVDQAARESDRLSAALEGFSILQPYFLKTLFSYAVFFVSLEDVYFRFYADLNELNRKPFLCVRHRKPPTKTPYVKKVRLIRNVAIAHVASSNTNPATAIAAASWQPMSIDTQVGGMWDLDRITFGALRVRTHDGTGSVGNSKDLKIQGIAELDRHCRRYLSEYDTVCASYLGAIHGRLPIDVGSQRYYSLPEPKT